MLGIDSVYCPMEIRLPLWNRIATDLKPENIADLVQKELTLEELPDALATILKGQARGRMIVKLY